MMRSTVKPRHGFSRRALSPARTSTCCFAGCKRHPSRHRRTELHMDITVVDATGNKTEEATVPASVAAGRIMAKLVELMELPTFGPDGQPLSYKFHHKQSGRQLGDHESLEQAGVKDGDVVRLVAEITAG